MADTVGVAAAIGFSGVSINKSGVDDSMAGTATSDKQRVA